MALGPSRDESAGEPPVTRSRRCESPATAREACLGRRAPGRIAGSVPARPPGHRAGPGQHITRACAGCGRQARALDVPSPPHPPPPGRSPSAPPPSPTARAAARERSGASEESPLPAAGHRASGQARFTRRATRPLRCPRWPRTRRRMRCRGAAPASLRRAGFVAARSPPRPVLRPASGPLLPAAAASPPPPPPQSPTARVRGSGLAPIRARARTRGRARACALSCASETLT